MKRRCRRRRMDGVVSRGYVYSSMRWWGTRNGDGDGFCSRGTAEAYRRATLGRVRFRASQPDLSPHCSCAWDFEQTIFSPPSSLPNIASKVSRQIVNPFVKPTYTPCSFVRRRSVIFKSPGLRTTWSLFELVSVFFFNCFPLMPDSNCTKKKPFNKHWSRKEGEPKKRYSKHQIRILPTAGGILKNTNR